MLLITLLENKVPTAKNMMMPHVNSPTGMTLQVESYVYSSRSSEEDKRRVASAWRSFLSNWYNQVLVSCTNITCLHMTTDGLAMNAVPSFLIGHP